MSRDSLLDDNADNLRLVAAGICLITVVGWVVRFCVDVKRLCRSVFCMDGASVRQVECDIEVVNRFKVALNCYLQSVFLEVPCYFLPCPFYLGPCGIPENSESVVRVESDVVCSVFVCKVVQDKEPN